MRLVTDDIRGVVSACHAAGAGSKVIIETALLTDEEKITACTLAKAAGADFVKTSTGFGPGGATAADVALMRRVVGDEMGVKASGGVRDLEQMKAMVAAGATRIGASAGVRIVKESRGETRGDGKGQRLLMVPKVPGACSAWCASAWCWQSAGVGARSAQTRERLPWFAVDLHGASVGLPTGRRLDPRAGHRRHRLARPQFWRRRRRHGLSAAARPHHIRRRRVDRSAAKGSGESLTITTGSGATAITRVTPVVRHAVSPASSRSCRSTSVTSSDGVT